MPQTSHPHAIKLTSRVDHVSLAINQMSLGIVSHLDRAVDVHSAAAAHHRRRCCRLLLAGPSVPVVVLLQRRATAAARACRHQRAAAATARLGGLLLLLLLLLRAARSAAPQRFQFSLGSWSRAGSGASTVRDVVDGRLHWSRRAGVGSFSYAHGKHHEFVECASLYGGVRERREKRESATVILIIQSE